MDYYLNYLAPLAGVISADGALSSGVKVWLLRQ